MKSRLIKIFILMSSMFLMGCHKLGVITHINSDGSGELRTEVGFSAEERKTLEEESDNPEDFCSTTEAPTDITIVEEQRGEETWCITTTPFNNLDELRDLYQQRSGLTINQLEIVNEVLYYDLDMDILAEDSSFSAMTEIMWLVVLPTQPTNHNADEVNGNRLTWFPNPTNGVFNIHAESEVPSAGLNSPLCNSAFIGLAAVVLHQISRRKNS